MVLTINGHVREFTELQTDASLSALIEILGLKGDRVAIERNGEIVSRADWPRTALADQDKLEVVHFVGGGSFDQAAGTHRFPHASSPKPAGLFA